MSIELGRTPHAAAYESVQSAFAFGVRGSGSASQLYARGGYAWRITYRSFEVASALGKRGRCPSSEPNDESRAADRRRRSLVGPIAPAMTAIGQALDSLNDPEKDVQGTLRITVPTVAYSLLLERHIADFLHRYPMLQLEMLIEDALVDIVSAGLDAGIRLGERLALDMVATPLLRTERMAVVAAPSYLSGKPPIESPADLLQHECIRFRLKTNGTLYPWTLTIGGESRAVDVEGRLGLNSMPAVLNAAIGGCGVACTFERLAASAIADGRLHQLLPGHCQDYPGWFLYFSSRRHMSARLRAFIDFFRAANADTWERLPAQFIGRRRSLPTQERIAP
jgi:DNA-binding transcriptional LysR family regulator